MTSASLTRQMSDSLRDGTQFLYGIHKGWCRMTRTFSGWLSLVPATSYLTSIELHCGGKNVSTLRTAQILRTLALLAVISGLAHAGTITTVDGPEIGRAH